MDCYLAVFHGDFIGGIFLVVNSLALSNVFITIVDDVAIVSLFVGQCSLIGREIPEKYG